MTPSTPQAATIDWTDPAKLEVFDTRTRTVCPRPIAHVAKMSLACERWVYWPSADEQLLEYEKFRSDGNSTGHRGYSYVIRPRSPAPALQPTAFVPSPHEPVGGVTLRQQDGGYGMPRMIYVDGEFAHHSISLCGNHRHEDNDFGYTSPNTRQAYMDTVNLVKIRDRIRASRTAGDPPADNPIDRAFNVSGPDADKITDILNTGGVSAVATTGTTFETAKGFEVTGSSEAFHRGECNALKIIGEHLGVPARTYAAIIRELDRRAAAATPAKAALTQAEVEGRHTLHAFRPRGDDRHLCMDCARPENSREHIRAAPPAGGGEAKACEPFTVETWPKGATLIRTFDDGDGWYTVAYMSRVGVGIVHEADEEDGAMRGRHITFEELVTEVWELSTDGGATWRPSSR